MASIDILEQPVVDSHAVLFPFEKTARTHAILCVIGFLGILPMGAMTARMLRTFTRLWFPVHLIIQTVIAGPIIIAGVAMGIHSVKEAESPKLGDEHKKLGIALFVLYLAQVMGGLLVHFWKPVWSPRIFRKPVQNYLHAIVGIVIVVLAFWEVRVGYKTEWPSQTGLQVHSFANIAWIVAVVVIPVIYLALVALLLRRQFRQERVVADGASDEHAIKTEGATMGQTY